MNHPVLQHLELWECVSQNHVKSKLYLLLERNQLSLPEVVSLSSLNWLYLSMVSKVKSSFLAYDRAWYRYLKCWGINLDYFERWALVEYGNGAVYYFTNISHNADIVLNHILDFHEYLLVIAFWVLNWVYLQSNYSLTFVIICLTLVSNLTNSAPKLQCYSLTNHSIYSHQFHSWNLIIIKNISLTQIIIVHIASISCMKMRRWCVMSYFIS